MRILNAAVGAALLILVASPALAGDGRGGGGGQHGCVGGCGHRPAPYTLPPYHGPDYNRNINVNVNALSGTSERGYLNARPYDVSGIRGYGYGYGYGGGTVHVGGGYGGDVGGYYGAGAVYNEEVYGGRACASAPFGYVVSGFGRNGREVPACAGAVCREGDDRGGRYGYSARQGCGTDPHEAYGSYGESRARARYGAYRAREEYRQDSAYGGGEIHGGVRVSDGRSDCGCYHGAGHDHTPYPPPYLPDLSPEAAPEPPTYAPSPHGPRPSTLPRQEYRQEPGERG